MKNKILLSAALALTSTLGAEPTVLALSGSTRTGSLNTKLVQEAKGIAEQMGAKVTIIDLKDYPMPFYDADLEAKEGLPDNAKRLRNLMIESDAIIIASPEYNSSIPAVLKNALDWASRGADGKPSRDAFKGKKFAIMSASPGSIGGARALVHLQAIIENVGGEVIKPNVSVAQAHNAFDAKGVLAASFKQELTVQMGQLLPSATVAVSK